MLALSPPPLFSNYERAFEEDNINIKETNYSDSLLLLDHLPSPDPTRFQHGQLHATAEFQSQYPMAMNMMAKKLNHNASERDRRKRVNNLYYFLCSLLPAGDQKKKVSIPGTVSRALKYIPELQKEVERLIHKKEKLLLSSSNSCMISQIEEDVVSIRMKKQITRNDDTIINRKCSSSSSVSVVLVGNRQVVVQLNKSSSLLLSQALQYLEEVDRLVLLNASSFKSFGFGEETVFYTLHFQVQGNHKIEVEMLKEKLFSFHHKQKNVFFDLSLENARLPERSVPELIPVCISHELYGTT